MAEVKSLEEADVVIVNTCGFIREACEESIDTILEIDRLKTNLRIKPPIIVLGCMAQRYRRELFLEMKESQAVLGCHWTGELEKAIAKTLEGSRFCGGFEPSGKSGVTRLVDSSNTYLIVRISDGCDRSCAFCTIPSFRGRFRSVSPEEIIKEIRMLTLQREREIILVAQDLTSYGLDLLPKTDLSSLIEMISKIEGVRWIRLLYLQPDGITDKLIDEIAQNEKICKYLDIPFQHSSPAVLRRMGRKGSKEEFLGLIWKIRERIPQVAIRTTLMVGFPKESESDFDNLVSFVEEARFDWVGLFKYSDEEGTTSYSMEGKIDEATANERYDTILSLQERIEEEKVSRLVGSELELVIDGNSDLPEYKFRGRSYREAPEIDGSVYVKVPPAASLHLSPGDFVNSRIIDVEGLDPVAQV